MAPPTFSHLWLDTSSPAHALAIIRAVLSGTAGKSPIAGPAIQKVSPHVGDVYVVQPCLSPHDEEHRHTDDITWLSGSPTLSHFISYKECVARVPSPLMEHRHPIRKDPYHGPSHLSRTHPKNKKKQGRVSLAYRDSSQPKAPKILKEGGMLKYTFRYPLSTRYPKHVLRLIYYTSSAFEAANHPYSPSYSTPALSSPSWSATPFSPITPSSPTTPFSPRAPTFDSSFALARPTFVPEPLPAFRSFVESRSAAFMHTRMMMLLRSEGVE